MSTAYIGHVIRENARARTKQFKVNLKQLGAHMDALCVDRCNKARLPGQKEWIANYLKELSLNPDLKQDCDYNNLFKYLDGMITRFASRDSGLAFDTVIPNLGINIGKWFETITQSADLNKLKLHGKSLGKGDLEASVAVRKNLSVFKSGDVYESRVAAALACIMDEYDSSQHAAEVRDFICVSPHINGDLVEDPSKPDQSPASYYDSWGIDFFVEMRGSSPSSIYYVPLQIKSDEKLVSKDTRSRTISLRASEYEALMTSLGMEDEQEFDSAANNEEDDDLDRAQRAVEFADALDEPDEELVDIEERRPLSLRPNFKYLSVKDKTLMSLKDYLRRFCNPQNAFFKQAHDLPLRDLIERHKVTAILGQMIKRGLFYHDEEV